MASQPRSRPRKAATVGVAETPVEEILDTIPTPSPVVEEAPRDPRQKDHTVHLGDLGSITLGVIRH